MKCGYIVMKYLTINKSVHLSVIIVQKERSHFLYIYDEFFDTIYFNVEFFN